jgi:hypothetical protein
MKKISKKRDSSSNKNNKKKMTMMKMMRKMMEMMLIQRKTMMMKKSPNNNQRSIRKNHPKMLQRESRLKKKNLNTLILIVKHIRRSTVIMEVFVTQIA